jgi:protein-S-isoprenylcysteine O-methyltransferase Ste14
VPWGALAIALLVAVILIRVAIMRRAGIGAMKFGEIDKTDFLIPPFALLYIYLIFANAFQWRPRGPAPLFQMSWLSWLGVAFCGFGLVLLFASLISFGRSFRVGIDTDRPDKLATSGVFAITRNPMYVSFGLVLLGQFLIDSSWVMLAYLIAGVALFHRQVLREEEYLSRHYGEEYQAYRAQVRRYL